MGEEIRSRAVTTKGTGFSDYQINIRALEAQDKAHQSLPYFFDSWEAQDTNIVNNTTETNQMPAASNDRYVTSVELKFTDSANFMQKQHEGVIVTARIENGTTITLWKQSFCSFEVQPVYDGTNYVLTIEIFPPISWKIPSDKKFYVDYNNNTGNTIDIIDITVKFMEPT